jgi:hypothetical protein
MVTEASRDRDRFASGCRRCVLNDGAFIRGSQSPPTDRMGCPGEDSNRRRPDPHRLHIRGMHPAKARSTAVFGKSSHPGLMSLLLIVGIFKRPVDSPTRPVVNSPGSTGHGWADDDRRIRDRIGPVTPRQGRGRGGAGRPLRPGSGPPHLTVRRTERIETAESHESHLFPLMSQYLLAPPGPPGTTEIARRSPASGRPAGKFLRRARATTPPSHLFLGGGAHGPGA